LLDAQELSLEEAARRMAATLSVGEEPARAAAWVEGFLSGSALILLHDRALLAVVDDWLAGVGDEAFTDVLPLLRRTFATFGEAERRQISRRVKSLGDAAAPRQEEGDLDVGRAELVLPVLGRLLGTGR
jgi:hypothetical protein